MLASNCGPLWSMEHNAASFRRRSHTITNASNTANKRKKKTLLDSACGAIECAKRPKDVSMTRRKVDSCLSIDGTVHSVARLITPPFMRNWLSNMHRRCWEAYSNQLPVILIHLIGIFFQHVSVFSAAIFLAPLRWEWIFHIARAHARNDFQMPTNRHQNYTFFYEYIVGWRSKNVHKVFAML